MSIDWEYIGQGIAEIGSMVSGTIMETYRAKLAEQRFLDRYGEMMRIREPYDKRAMERTIAGNKEAARYAIGLQREQTKWKTNYTNNMMANLNSPELQKRREKAMKSGDPIEQTNIMALDSMIGKLQRGEEVDPNDPVVQSLPPIARMNFNREYRQNVQANREFGMKMNKFFQESAKTTSLIQSRADVEADRQFDRDQDRLDLGTKEDEKVTDLVTLLQSEGDLIYDRGSWLTKEDNKSVINTDGEFVMEGVKALLKKKPEYAAAFKEIVNLRQRRKELGGEGTTGEDISTLPSTKTRTATPRQRGQIERLKKSKVANIGNGLLRAAGDAVGDMITQLETVDERGFREVYGVSKKEIIAYLKSQIKQGR